MGYETGRLLFIDPDTPAATAEIRLDAYPVYAAAASPGGDDVFFVAGFPGRRKDLVRFDLKRRVLRWRLELSSGDSLRTHNGAMLIADQGLTVSHDGRRIYAAPALQDGVEGVATVDAETSSVIGFVGPFLTYGPLRTIEDQQGAAGDVLLASGTRSMNRRAAAESAFVILAPSFQILRSFVAPTGSSHIWDLEPLPGGDLLVVGGDRSIGLYNRQAGTYVHVVTRMGGGGVFGSLDGASVVQTDCGLSSVRSSGLVRLLNGQLETRAVVDLNPFPLDEEPPCTARVAFSSTHDRLYVAAGSGRPRLDFLPEPSRVFVIELGSANVRSVFDPKDWGVGWLFPIR